MNLQHFTTVELIRARDAAGYLLGCGARLDCLLRVKLDTFRADVTAAIEDRDRADVRGEDPLDLRDQIRRAVALGDRL
ncbi:MAG TPA: hypothetical protein VGM53_33430 [Streptosporangiaceae bacterium]|jgi:hypothetical protein